MTVISQPPENVNSKLAAALEAATLVRDNAPHHAHYDFTDVLTGELLHDPDNCPHCAFRRLWHRYTQALNDEIEERAEKLYRRTFAVSPRERTTMIQQCERDLEVAALVNFDLELSSVTDITPRRRLEIGAAFERAKRLLDTVTVTEVPHDTHHQ